MICFLALIFSLLVASASARHPQRKASVPQVQITPENALEVYEKMIQGITQNPDFKLGPEFHQADGSFRVVKLKSDRPEHLAKASVTTQTIKKDSVTNEDVSVEAISSCTSYFSKSCGNGVTCGTTTVGGVSMYYQYMTPSFSSSVQFCIYMTADISAVKMNYNSNTKSVSSYFFALYIFFLTFNI